VKKVMLGRVRGKRPPGLAKRWSDLAQQDLRQLASADCNFLEAARDQAQWRHFVSG